MQRVFDNDLNMDWETAHQMLLGMSSGYTNDNLRKLTYNREIFPLVLRFDDGERSEVLYKDICNIYNQLRKFSSVGS